MIDEQYSEILSKKTNFGISDALFNQFKSQVVNERKK
jgi:Rod binding domain-containing protein